VTDTKAPPRYKMALLTWAGAFPLLTAVNVLLGPLLVALPLPGRTLLMTGLLVSLLTYVIMPRLTRLCAAWLSPSGVRWGPDEKVASAERLSRVHNPLSAHDVRRRTA
jgi:antibiotic biosynthesis monooxygenase (ABM) superfamily enzyme